MNQQVQAKAVDTGVPYPLGATVTKSGVNFALFSANAERVELCLFSDDGLKEVSRIALPEKTDDVWHGEIKGLAEGACYGYRVYGPFDPARGHRFNHHKLLLDPYAKALKGTFRWDSSLYAYPQNNEKLDLAFDDTDSAAFVPKAVVTGPLGKAVEPLSRPVPWSETVVYEMHLRGFTRAHNRIPENLRGRYLGMAHSESVGYLKDLGITSVELLPIHTFIDEHFLVKKGLVNYWGYNTLNFFTPHPGYANENAREEFRTMVEHLHAAGIEVLLDVVYNHTGEGNHLGPTLSLRGIDNASYYGLESSDSRFYINDTGCGNTLNMKNAHVRQLVLDSLRYWADDMGVDGFRFDLATVLGREANGFASDGRFFEMIQQDPVLATKKMIAEPWDIGPGGYQLGNYPNRWAEWNDKYRDTCRRFWRGDSGVLPEFARRIHGSSDIFEHSGKRPFSSINFIAAHDGFTVRDIVSYNKKHNDANKEQNQDGHNANFSYNHGIEGPTNNSEINQLRNRQQRNLLATLLLSQGTPMLNMGDELGRTQQGNNNAYCQDNELNWLNWKDLVLEHWQLKSFIRNVLKLRKQHPILRSQNYIHKPDEDGIEQRYNIHWLNVDGKQMSEQNWLDDGQHAVGWMLESIADKQNIQCVLTLFNACNCSTLFCLPGQWRWRAVLDTRIDSGKPKDMAIGSPSNLLLQEKSLMVLVGERTIDEASEH